MSERSSFVTEYIYCPKCFEAMKALMIGEDDKYFTARIIGDFPIIAGKVGTTAPGLEWDTLNDVLDDAHKTGAPWPCHSVAIAVPEG